MSNFQRPSHIKEGNPPPIGGQQKSHLSTSSRAPSRIRVKRKRDEKAAPESSLPKTSQSGEIPHDGSSRKSPRTLEQQDSSIHIKHGPESEWVRPQLGRGRSSSNKQFVTPTMLPTHHSAPWMVASTPSEHELVKSSSISTSPLWQKQNYGASTSSSHVNSIGLHPNQMLLATDASGNRYIIPAPMSAASTAMAAAAATPQYIYKTPDGQIITAMGQNQVAQQVTGIMPSISGGGPGGPGTPVERDQEVQEAFRQKSMSKGKVPDQPQQPGPPFVQFGSPHQRVIAAPGGPPQHVIQMTEMTRDRSNHHSRGGSAFQATIESSGNGHPREHRKRPRAELQLESSKRSPPSAEEFSAFSIGNMQNVKQRETPALGPIPNFSLGNFQPISPRVVETLPGHHVQQQQQQQQHLKDVANSGGAASVQKQLPSKGFGPVPPNATPQGGMAHHLSALDGNKKLIQHRVPSLTPPNQSTSKKVMTVGEMMQNIGSGAASGSHVGVGLHPNPKQQFMSPFMDSDEAAKDSKLKEQFPPGFDYDPNLPMPLKYQLLAYQNESQKRQEKARMDPAGSSGSGGSSSGLRQFPSQHHNGGGTSGIIQQVGGSHMVKLEPGDDRHKMMQRGSGTKSPILSQRLQLVTQKQPPTQQSSSSLRKSQPSSMKHLDASVHVKNEGDSVVWSQHQLIPGATIPSSMANQFVTPMLLPAHMPGDWMVIPPPSDHESVKSSVNSTSNLPRTATPSQQDKEKESDAGSKTRVRRKSLTLMPKPQQQEKYMLYSDSDDSDIDEDPGGVLAPSSSIIPPMKDGEKLNTGAHGLPMQFGSKLIDVIYCCMFQE